MGFPQRIRTCHNGKLELRINFGLVLSAVIIAKNECANLPRCLRSIQEVADEIVVVDSDSTDGTPEVATSFGARVFKRSFTTYADQKNWAASQATHPFILSLDADEALSESLLAEIRDWKKRRWNQPSAWAMPRLTYVCRGVLRARKSAKCGATCDSFS